jgi:hypothetical protein
LAKVKKKKKAFLGLFSFFMDFAVYEFFLVKGDFRIFLG